MKVVLYIIIGLVLLSIIVIAFPLIIGGLLAYLFFSEGSIVAGIITSIIALSWQIGMLIDFGIFDNGFEIDSCPYCDSGDTDGNHCYSCGEDS